MFFVRHLQASDLPEQVDLIVIDVSFISLKKILPAALSVLKPAGEIVALVKPQFEVERGNVGKGGIVRDEEAALPGALESVAGLVDRIDICDTGSVDGRSRSSAMPVAPTTWK